MSDETSAIPREIRLAEAARRRGFRRFLWAAAIWLVSLVVIRFGWGCEASRWLSNRIRDCQAAGEPILVADFNRRPVIPDEKNAAVLYNQAFAALVRQTETPLDFEDMLSEPRVCAAYPRSVRAYLDANRRVLDLIRLARGLSDADWGYEFSHPMYESVAVDWPSKMGKLARFTRIAALDRVRQGDQTEAVEILFDLEAIAKHLGRRGCATLLSHLFSLTICDQIQSRTLASILPALEISDVRSESSVRRPVDRSVLISLIKSLLDEQWLRSSWRESMYSERAAWLDNVHGYLDGTAPLCGVTTISAAPDLTERGRRLVLSPVYLLGGVDLMDRATKLVEAGKQTDWTKAGSMLDPLDEECRVISSYSIRTCGATLLPAMDHAAKKLFNALAVRRMAAAAIALRLYELDHGGRPESLEALVPDYLSTVPSDPFLEDGRFIMYKPDADRPHLLSANRENYWELVQELGEDVADELVLVFYLDGFLSDLPMMLDRTDEALLKAFEGQQEVNERSGDSNERHASD